jgi:tripartite-type tricarboxylate transporter receptor subunit TctC
VNILHVPYKGDGPAAVAILTDEAQLMFGTGPSVVPHIEAIRSETAKCAKVIEAAHIQAE